MNTEIVFEVKGEAYKVRKPTSPEYREARKVYNVAFNDAIASKAKLKACVNQVLQEQGLWNEEKQNELEGLYKEINDKVYRLQAGGIKLSEGKKLALEIAKARTKAQVLAAPIVMFNQHTAEGIADNAKFDYLLSVCLVYLDGRPYYQNAEDYSVKNDNGDEVTLVGARKFAELMYEVSEDFVAGLPENQFLKEYKFVDDKYRLINKDGHLVDEEGKLVNEEGRYVDAEGNLVNADGKRVDEEGNFVVERKPFLDEDDQPITGDSVKDNTEE